MAIYTRSGDQGKTSLFDGSRTVKSNKRVEAYGSVDELNSFVGMAMASIKKQKSRTKVFPKRVEIFSELEQIQHDLLDIGSALATPAALPVVGMAVRAEHFEKLIDAMTVQMPELKNFILPGGSEAGAGLHICRTVSRRTERRVVALAQKEEIDATILVYLNRLSDLFFTMARYSNFIEEEKEVRWKKK